MSQLARRENAPHRAAFVTSLSRWYIRRLLGNLPPFHPCLSAERRPRIVPCETSSPYGRIPWKSRCSKPFLSSSQCIRNWPRSWARGCLITGAYSCAAKGPRRHTLWDRAPYQCRAGSASGRWYSGDFGLFLYKGATWNRKCVGGIRCHRWAKL